MSSVACARATSSSAPTVGDGLVDAALSAPDVKVGQRTLPVARATPHVEKRSPSQSSLGGVKLERAQVAMQPPTFILERSSVGHANWADLVLPLLWNQTKMTSKAKKPKRATRTRLSEDLIAVEAIDRKLDPLPNWIHVIALKRILYGLFRLPQSDWLDRPEADDAHLFLEGMLRWIVYVDDTLEVLFAKSSPELGEREALYHLRRLAGLLRDLQDGSQNVLTAALRRRKSDRRDPRRVREAKDTAARVYKLLVQLGASSSEATEAINSAFKTFTEMYEVKRITAWTADNLKKRASRTHPLEEGDMARVLGIFRTDQSWIGRFSNHTQRRKQQIGVVCAFLLASSIRVLPVQGKR